MAKSKPKPKRCSTECLFSFKNLLVAAEDFIKTPCDLSFEMLKRQTLEARDEVKNGKK